MKRSSKVFDILLVITTMCVGTLVINLIHFRFFRVHVVLYDSLLDTCIASIAVGAIFATMRQRWLSLSPEELGLSATIALLCGFLYAVCVPTIIDRSLSIYILEKLNQRNGAILHSAMDGIFKDEYMREQRLVDIRLTEQIKSGTISIQDDCVRLTGFGRRIATLTRLYRTTLLPKYREVRGETTDELTDPFRHSPARVDYACRIAQPRPAD